MTKGKTLADWLRENHTSYKGKEELVLAACKAFPASTRKSVLTRMSDLVKQGQLPVELIGVRGAGSAKKATEGGSVPKKTTKSGGNKVPKRFRMAVDVDLVKNEWDDEGKIDEGLANLDDQVIKDNDFRQELGIAQDRWKLVSNSEKYSDNKIELKGKAYRGMYWGRKDVIAAIRRKVDIL